MDSRCLGPGTGVKGGGTGRSIDPTGHDVALDIEDPRGRHCLSDRREQTVEVVELQIIIDIYIYTYRYSIIYMIVF